MFRSATVDSNLFSRYFSNCPVITAEGRTHPVTTYFLEDIYESISYRLAADSPASIRNETSTNERVSYLNTRLFLI
jgi:ATP-dependent RNA helicase DHX29